MSESAAGVHCSQPTSARVAGELLATFAVTSAAAVLASFAVLGLHASYSDRFGLNSGGEFAFFIIGERSFVLALLLFAPPVGFQLVGPATRGAASLVDRLASALLPFVVGCVIVLKDPSVISKSVAGGQGASAWVLLAPAVLLLAATPLCVASRRWRTGTAVDPT